ncbi:hypothetical protein [Novosphingobium sp. Gsoil 351]|uniref:hypothetical protein n=1 Tax=Novosphingobium sp. Gsoil 351 TaxID=2675225 RepID=UPI0012B4DD4F|nr:hypothetical protein [Novosphingobium sp. Gsoil 351]QGN55663.1 hypothetical protein GKE62_15040 [Novosphingobium sp. Gsoil 351]
MPSAEVLAGARERIVDWWTAAWLHTPVLRERFGREVVVALPVEDANDLDQVFAGLEWRRLRLRQDQELTEWGGAAIAATA